MTQSYKLSRDSQSRRDTVISSKTSIRGCMPGAHDLVIVPPTRYEFSDPSCLHQPQQKKTNFYLRYLLPLEQRQISAAAGIVPNAKLIYLCGLMYAYVQCLHSCLMSVYWEISLCWCSALNLQALRHGGTFPFSLPSLDWYHSKKV